MPEDLRPGFLWIRLGDRVWNVAEIYGEMPFFRLRVWTRGSSEVREIRPDMVSRWGPYIEEPPDSYGRYQGMEQGPDGQLVVKRPNP